MSTELKLIPGTLPSGYCPTTEQERYNKYFALGYAQLDAGSGYTIKVDASPPSAAERSTNLWMPTSGAYIGKVFRYLNGYWTSPHPIPASSDFRRIVAAGSESDVWSLELGGAVGDNPAVTAPTAYTGALWEVDHNFDDRSFMGVKNTVAIAADGGAATVTPTSDNLPEHRHESGVPYTDTAQEPPYGETPITEAHTLAFPTLATAGSGNANAYTQYTGENGSDITPLDIIHPVRGVWVVKRTSRIYFTTS